MLASKGGPVSGKPDAKLVLMANGAVATLRGRVSLEQIHRWIDQVSRMGHCDWAIIDLREMKASEGGVWSTVEMGLKKLTKKGAKRMVVVVNGQEQIQLIQSTAKRAGIGELAEYFDASKRPFSQVKVTGYLRDHWKDKK